MSNFVDETRWGRGLSFRVFGFKDFMLFFWAGRLKYSREEYFLFCG